MTHDKLRQSLVVLGIVLIATGLVAGAAPVIDTETTDTSTTSDVAADTTIVGFEANSNNSTHIEASSLTANASMKLIDPDTGVVYYTNSTPTATNETAGYYAWDISHDEWENLPVKSGGNKTLTLRLINDTTVDDPDTTNVTFSIEGAPGRTVVHISSAQIGDDAIVKLGDPGWGISVLDTDFELFGAWAPEPTTSQDSVSIDGEDSTIKYHIENDSAASQYHRAAENKDDGETIWSTIVTADKRAIPVYKNNTPEDVNETSDSYAIYSGDENASDLKIHLGDSFENESSVNVFMKGNGDEVDQLTTYGLMQWGTQNPMGALGDFPEMPFSTGIGFVGSLSGLVEQMVPAFTATDFTWLPSF